MRALTSRDIGIESPEREAVAELGRNGRILIVDDRHASYERVAADASAASIRPISRRSTAGLLRRGGQYDLLIVSPRAREFRRIALCKPGALPDRTPQLPILGSRTPRTARGSFAAGDRRINDYLSRPIDKKS